MSERRRGRSAEGRGASDLGEGRKEEARKAEGERRAEEEGSTAGDEGEVQRSGTMARGRERRSELVVERSRMWDKAVDGSKLAIEAEVERPIEEPSSRGSARPSTPVAAEEHARSSGGAVGEGDSAVGGPKRRRKLASKPERGCTATRPSSAPRVSALESLSSLRAALDLAEAGGGMLERLPERGGGRSRQSVTAVAAAAATAATLRSSKSTPPTLLSPVSPVATPAGSQADPTRQETANATPEKRWSTSTTACGRGDGPLSAEEEGRSVFDCGHPRRYARGERGRRRLFRRRLSERRGQRGLIEERLRAWSVDGAVRSMLEEAFPAVLERQHEGEAGKKGDDGRERGRT